MKERIIELKKIVERNVWVESATNGNSGVGLTLERLVGKERENFEWPDYYGIELKARCATKEQHITLFSAVPDSYLFEIKRITNTYGYPDNKYPEFNKFNVSVYGNRRIQAPSGFWFYLHVDRQNEKLTLRVFDKYRNLIDTDTSWSFELLKEKLERKLSYLALVKAERKWFRGSSKAYYRYNSINLYQLKDFKNFLNLIESGRIRLTFKIGVYKDEKRFGQIYDHGTSFDIQECHLENLFDLITIE